MTAQNLTLIAAGTLTSLTAGVFFAFVCAVNLGLGRLGDLGYLTAMQSINEKIQNPAFGLIFMGPVLLLPVTTVLHAGDGWPFGLLLAASVLYILGTFGITAGGNVPLNNRLASVDLGKLPAARLTEIRGWFEAPWQRLHVLRTWCAILAVIAIYTAAAL
jgi:uncharacterized membrane protein